MNKLARGSPTQNLSQTINRGQSVASLYMRCLRLTKFVYGQGEQGQELTREVKAAFRSRQFETDRDQIKDHLADARMFSDRLFNIAAMKLIPDEYKQSEAYKKQQEDLDKVKSGMMAPEQAADPFFIPMYRPAHDHSREMKEDTDNWREIEDVVKQLNNEYWAEKMEKWRTQCAEQTKAIRDRRLAALKEDGILPEDAPCLPEEREAWEAAHPSDFKLKRQERRRKARRGGRSRTSLDYR